MKQHRFQSLIFATVMLSITLLSACSGEESAEIADVPSADGTYNYKLHLNFQIADSTTEATRASISLTNGMTVYLRFGNGSSYISGMAVYSSSSGTWNVSTNSSLPSVTSSRSCEAYYFKNPGTIYSSSINLTENTACYQGSGIYSHPNTSDVFVNVTLKPKNWRLRFYGSSGSRITIQESGSDIYYYTSFNRNSGEFSSQKKNVSLTVVSNSYTPYVYGIFKSASTANSIAIATGSNELYYRNINGTNLQNRGSGYLTIPTSSNYSSYGWNKLGASMSETRFGYSGASRSLKITAPAGMSWTLSTSNSSYVTLSKYSGTGNASVTVTLSSNSNSYYRYPTLTFKAGSDYSQTISLSQGYRERIINYWSIKYPGGTNSYKMNNVQVGDILEFDWDAQGQKHQLNIYLQGASYVELVNRSFYGGYDNYSGHKTYTFTKAGNYTLYLKYSTSYEGQYYVGGVLRNANWIHY